MKEEVGDERGERRQVRGKCSEGRWEVKEKRGRERDMKETERGSEGGGG